MKQASDNPQINFTLHTIEMYDAPLDAPDALDADPGIDENRASPRMIAGEIGYTIGHVYTSLSGFTTREIAGLGTIQLVCELMCTSPAPTCTCQVPTKHHPC